MASASRTAPAWSSTAAANRQENRNVAVFDPLDTFASSDWQPHVAAIVWVERNVFTRAAKTGLWQHSAHSAYYISNTKITAERAAQAIRAHWTIENTSHYTRDVTMGEDQSRIRSRPGVFARLRSFAYNILKANKISTLSQDRYRAALGGLWPLLKLLAIQQR
jgi:predicted transposase YbfD/YdcC